MAERHAIVRRMLRRAVVSRLPQPAVAILRRVARTNLPHVAEAPWDRTYLARRERFIAATLDDPRMMERFADASDLPPSYGLGYDERCVEYPWLLAQAPSGVLLDAGSTLNHSFVLDRILPTLDALHVVTLSYEGLAFPERNVSYVYDDLRRLPYRDGFFTGVASLSTLEHVGMDNTRYGGQAEAGEARRERLRAVGELRRVTKAGSRVFITVPYGRREDHGWLQQFDYADVEDLVAVFRDVVVTVYRYDVQDGWQLSTPDEAADSRFGAPAAAAGAVACISANV